ncbi:SsgA family sporulation/cell division regulator [Streptomyces sp. NBC_00193]|uniref:SsgA family sporulation/cell division regulator n=1 Tax=Streptomyces sp. NBC_00193 TaxID=2975675 RepID=UPI00224CD9A2|nr:SsgA family sporulation/cell division regulator [Streptomyces sp. NBC_00193]MCX5300433.1 SsgA family sporulation/cell division regulator [Streptomyces sp. NBC_00193]
MSLRRDGSLDDGLMVTDAFDEAFDVDFDALMEASSLGAPQVKAVLRAGPVPEDVHRRVGRAASASPASAPVAGVPAVRSVASEVEEERRPAGRGGDPERVLIVGREPVRAGWLGGDPADLWDLLTDRAGGQGPDAGYSEVSRLGPAWQRWKRQADELSRAESPAVSAVFWEDGGEVEIRQDLLWHIATAFGPGLEVGAVVGIELALRELLFAGEGGEVARRDTERPGSRAVAPYAWPSRDPRIGDLRGYPWVVQPVSSPDAAESGCSERLASLLGASGSWNVRLAVVPWWKEADVARTSSTGSEGLLRTRTSRKLAAFRRAIGLGTGDERWWRRPGPAQADRKGEVPSADRKADLEPRAEGPSTLRSWWERDGAEEVLRGRILMHLCGPAADASTWPLSARLTYRASDPYAVEMVFKDPGRGAGTSWMLARELLLEGLRGRAGRGDVQVWSEEEGDRPNTVHHDGQRRTYIRLVSPGGTALLFMGADHVAEFLEQSRRVVAPGTEHEHLSGGVAELEALLHGRVSPKAGEGAPRARGDDPRSSRSRGIAAVWSPRMQG